jgi:two-component system capsular synthesis sensor histidine kinase RcsC
VIWTTPEGPHRPRQCAPGIFEVTSFSHDALLSCVASVAAGLPVGPALPSTGEVTDRRVTSAISPLPSPLPDAAGLTILVAEDNPLNQTLISEQLRVLGCRPIVTDNGKQALAMAESTHVDAVLTDIHMPVMNGYALLDALQALRPDLPVLAFSALAQQEQAEDWQQRGFSGYITKPASLHELGEALQALHGTQPRERDDADTPSAAAGASQERYARLLRGQLQTDLPALARILAANDVRALQAWTHRAASGFRIVRQQALLAHCREVEQRCLGESQWTPAIAAAGEALQALALRYAGQDPAAPAQDRP